MGEASNAYRLSDTTVLYNQLKFFQNKKDLNVGNNPTSKLSVNYYNEVIWSY